MSTNLTLSVDETTVEKAREVARRQGTSLNALIREYIEQLAGKRTGADVAKRLEELWAEGRGNSGGHRFDREELYEERLGRYGKKHG
jgi:hypothetical protein